MSRYVLSDQANEDVDGVLREIAKSSPRAAVRMSDRFAARFRELAESPELGRSAKEQGPGLRRANEGVYAVFYRVLEDGIEIARVMHGMRDLPARFRD